MITTAKRPLVTWLALALLLGGAAIAPAATPPPPPGSSPPGAIGRTPPRLSYVDGEVSFWRPGAQDWAPAQVNTPLAPGDELYASDRSNLEVQVGSRAYVRAASTTQFGIANQEPDFLQLTLTSGHLALDLRSLDPGRTVELDTPHAAFTIDHPGYYRADVTEERTFFITRRAGHATMTPAGAVATAVAPSEEVVLEGAGTPRVQSYVAPDLDPWDQWNYARTDYLFEALSARYVPQGVYGVDELDHHGNWRVVGEYGPVWVPQGVPAGWAPYSTGRWIMDPFYGWTWVDTAPWGWAPYHYGRWVAVNGVWAWAPGPAVVRAVYAPALVAFFSAPGIRVSVDVGSAVSWVALGWGEPVVPWWGRPAFIGRPWWGGWGGPRVVNNVVVNRTTVVNVNTITVYRNASVEHAVVAVREDHFAGRRVQDARIAEVEVRRLEPVRGALAVRPEPASFVPAIGHAVRPPDAALSRRVVVTRPPAAPPAAVGRGAVERTAPVVSAPPARVVPAPRPMSATTVAPRPRFGTSQDERQRASAPPGFETRPPAAATTTRESTPRPGAVAPPPGERTRPATTRESTPHPGAVAPAPGEHAQSRSAAAPPAAAPHAPERRLPGEPANRLAPHRAQTEVHGPRGEAAPDAHPDSAPSPQRERGR